MAMQRDKECSRDSTFGEVDYRPAQMRIHISSMIQVECLSFQVLL